jgi:hypothetical protein
LKKTTWRQQGYKTRYKRVIITIKPNQTLFFGETSAKLENDAN